MELLYLDKDQTQVSTCPSATNRTSLVFKEHLVAFSLTFFCLVMTYKTFSEEKLSQAGQKNNKALISIFFTQTHLTVLNIKNCISKWSIKMFIKRTARAGNAYAYRMLLSLKMSLTYQKKINFMPGNCVHGEAAFVGYDSIFCRTLFDVRC